MNNRSSCIENAQQECALAKRGTITNYALIDGLFIYDPANRNFRKAHDHLMQYLAQK